MGISKFTFSKIVCKRIIKALSCFDRDQARPVAGPDLNQKRLLRLSAGDTISNSGEKVIGGTCIPCGQSNYVCEQVLYRFKGLVAAVQNRIYSKFDFFKSTRVSKQMYLSCVYKNV